MLKEKRKKEKTLSQVKKEERNEDVLLCLGEGPGQDCKDTPMVKLSRLSRDVGRRAIFDRKLPFRDIETLQLK